jgi:uncharacterized membrane protein
MNTIFLSAFGGWLWTIPTGLVIASGIFFYKGYKQGHSGSVTGYDNRPSDMNAKFFQCPENYFGILFFVIAIVAALWMYSDR